MLAVVTLVSPYLRRRLVSSDDQFVTSEQLKVLCAESVRNNGHVVGTGEASGGRTAQGLRERWRKTLKARFVEADGDPAAAAAAQYAAQVRTPA